MELLLKVMAMIKCDDERRHTQAVERMAEYRIAAEAEVAHRRRLGLDESDIVPHPRQGSPPCVG